MKISVLHNIPQLQRKTCVKRMINTANINANKALPSSNKHNNKHRSDQFQLVYWSLAADNAETLLKLSNSCIGIIYACSYVRLVDKCCQECV